MLSLHPFFRDLSSLGRRCLKSLASLLVAWGRDVWLGNAPGNALSSGPWRLWGRPRGGHAMCVAIQPVSVFWVFTWFDGGFIYICVTTEASYDFTGFPCETRLRILRIWIQLGVDFFYLPLGSGSHLFCDLPREGGLWSVEEFTGFFTRECIVRLFSLWCAVLVVRLAAWAQLCGPRAKCVWSDTTC